MTTLFKVKHWVGPFNSWAIHLKHWGRTHPPLIDASDKFSESIKVKVWNRLCVSSLSLNMFWQRSKIYFIV